MIKVFIVRKVINQINIINETLSNFLFLISFCIKKKYFRYFKENISLIQMSNRILLGHQNQLSNGDSDNNNPKNIKMIKDNNNKNFNLTTNNEKTIRNDFINLEQNEYQMTHNVNFYPEENNNLDNNNEEIQILKEKINIIDNNIKEINKEDINLIMNINDRTENSFINYDNKQDKINTDFNNIYNNNENTSYNNISKNKKPMALINAQLNELKKKK
jgi:hypothetical protein